MLKYKYLFLLLFALFVIGGCDNCAGEDPLKNCTVKSGMNKLYIKQYHCCSEVGIQLNGSNGGSYYSQDQTMLSYCLPDGEYMIVHLGYGIKKMKSAEAKKMLTLFKEIAKLAEETE